MDAPLLDLEIVGAPVPWQRTTSWNGRRLTPEETRAWEAHVAWKGAVAHRGKPLDGPLIIELWFWLPKPKRPMFPVPATQRDGDYDNLSKAVCDGLEKGRVLVNDARIVDAIIRKRYAEGGRKPGVTVLLWRFDARLDCMGEPDRRGGPGTRQRTQAEPGELAAASG